MTAASIGAGVRGLPGARRPPGGERDLRNRLAVLLQQRMQLVRSAARFVYRNHPSVVHEVTSAHERRRRAAARRASK